MREIIEQTITYQMFRDYMLLSARLTGATLRFSFDMSDSTYYNLKELRDLLYGKGQTNG